ncbi:MAG: penicillin-binding transpeptidase domain-containing protein, partial [Advenella sp.]
AAMPIWLTYMQTALKKVPVTAPGPMPEGLAKVGDNYYFSEFPLGKALANIGVSGSGARDPNAAKPAGSQSGDAIGKALESFNPMGGPPIRF